jgi:hypothetical protein
MMSEGPGAGPLARPTKRRSAAAVFALVTCALGLSVSSARADIYWSNQGSNSLGRASITGAHANQSFITGASVPGQVAVNAEHIYWANQTGTVGRANRNGSAPNESFVSTGIASNEGPLGVAVTRHSLYWSTGAQADFNQIGRSTLGGLSPNPTFVPFVSAVQLTSDANYLYFATGANTIGRVHLDGSGLNFSWITLPAGTYTQGVAVNDEHIYWTTLGGPIGRDTIDGNPLNINQNFITGSHEPIGLTIDHSYLYWANFAANTIGRDTIDGNPAHLDQSFITGANKPYGVAVACRRLPRHQGCT